MASAKRHPLRSSLATFAGVVTERQTYRNLLYLLITSFVGGRYFLGIFFGFFVALILTLTLVGIPLVLLLLAGTRGAAAFERRLTNHLLETEIRAPASGIDPRAHGPLPALRELIASDTTWKGVGFLAIKGLIAFFLPVFVLLAGFTSLVLTLAPLSSEVVVWEIWTIDTWIESLLAVPLGVAIGLATLHALNGCARVTGSIAESLL